MIPLILQIRNFLSYGPELQTIDFGPYPLICLSGKNGHGKSALLDAITWALWGQARKTLTTVKPDQGLLRLGQTHMMVVFDFELGGAIYRVRREFSLAYGKPSAQLEFGMLNKETGKLIHLTSKTIRATQEIIEQTMHIDFDSFTNSAFLRQGNANEFSKKSSKDRKEILASILGLGQYDTLRKRAMDKARNAATEKQALLILQEKLSSELQKKESLSAQLEVITTQLTTISCTEKQLDIQNAHIECTENTIAQDRHNASVISFKLEELIKTHNAEKLSLHEKYRTWRSIHRKRLQITDYAMLHNQKKNFVLAIDNFQKQLQAQLEIKKQHLEYTSHLHAHEQKLTRSHDLVAQKATIELESIRIELKNTKEHQLYLLEQKKALTQEIARYQSHRIDATLLCTELLDKEIIKAEQLFERRKEYYQNFRTRGTLIHNALQSSIQKKQLVHNEQDPSCPLCEQNLSASRRRFLQQKLGHNEQLLTHQRTRLLHVVKKLKEIIIAQYEHIQQLRATVQQRITLKLQQEEVIKNSQKTELALSVIMQQIGLNEQKEYDLHKRLIHTEAYAISLDRTKIDNLQNDTLYQQLITVLHTLTFDLEKIDYSVEAHRKAQCALLNIEKHLSEYEHIQAESAHQEQRKKDIFLLCHMLRNLQKQIACLTTSKNTYNNLSERISFLTEEKRKLIEDRKKQRHEKEYLLQEKGSIQTQQEKLDLLISEHTLNQQKIAELDRAMIDYHAIALATGKDGIQALLIEDAIPEIEQEANELLRKLTNNQAQIFIESLRDLKKGGTKETLDINISDATGIRPYELFSGGEAFRIDFALRIAISKLLARRAGTALQTLIIDEGFGSQDEEGLAHIMDALHIIQNDFSKVIIVSHLNAMKNQFPVHFIVEKTAQGSTVTILEQD